MSTESDQHSDDPAMDDPRRLAVALGYVFTPIVPLVNMAGAEATDSFTRRHSLQALLWTGPFILLLVLCVLALVLLMQSSFIFICLTPLAVVVPFIPGAIWGRRIYLGGEVRIPLLATLGERDNTKMR